MKIYNFSFPKNKKYLERVRDVFASAALPH